METIRNYLENMFMNLPDTEEVARARIELGQMMEDKYEELRRGGKSDNEAVAIVISEFGNLNELADELGINDQIQKQNSESEQAHSFSLDDVKKYLEATVQSSKLIAAGVCLLIISSASFLLFTSNRNVALIMFFVLIGVGVCGVVSGGLRRKGWPYVGEEPLKMDFLTTKYIKDDMSRFQPRQTLCITIGVFLCILCAMPSAVVNGAMSNLAHAALFGMVGAAVYLFIVAGMRSSAYKNLLYGTGTEKMSKLEKEARERAEEDCSPVGKAILSVYWPTILCIYLAWSFLTFAWGISWLIWPVAAAGRALIVEIFRRKG